MRGCRFFETSEDYTGRGTWVGPELKCGQAAIVFKDYEICKSSAHVNADAHESLVSAALPQHALERLTKEVFSPHDALVYAQPLVDVINAALEDPFPLGIAHREMFFAQRAQDL